MQEAHANASSADDSRSHSRLDSVLDDGLDDRGAAITSIVTDEERLRAFEAHERLSRWRARARTLAWGAGAAVLAAAALYGLDAAVTGWLASPVALTYAQDRDHDGVRDDVQRWIEVVTAGQERRHLHDAAFWFQQSLEAQDDESVAETSVRQARLQWSLACLTIAHEQEEPPAHGPVYRERPHPLNLQQEMARRVADTQARQRAHARHSERVERVRAILYAGRLAALDGAPMPHQSCLRDSITPQAPAHDASHSSP